MTERLAFICSQNAAGTTVTSLIGIEIESQDKTRNLFAYRFWQILFHIHVYINNPDIAFSREFLGSLFESDRQTEIAF